MQTSLTFKNLDPSDPLKEHVESKLNRLDKFLDNVAEANVVFSVEKSRHTAEISISGDRLNIISKEETHDMYKAFDLALDKIEKQLKKGKQKIRERREAKKSKNIPPVMPEVVELEFEKEKESDILVTHVDYKPMDVEEAVMQINLTKESFFVFTNAKTDQINVLYHRNDGKYGLIQPRV